MEPKDVSADMHYRELRKELSGKKSPLPPATPPIQVESQIKEITLVEIAKPIKHLTKQTSLNDELFFEERKKEKEAIRDKIKRQQSLPSRPSDDIKVGIKETLKAAAQSKQFDLFRDRFSKAKDTDKPAANSAENEKPNNTQNMSFTNGLAKILYRWKSEDKKEKPDPQNSFTRKRGVNIDPIVVFGLRRDQSLDSATRRGLFHKKGAWSPKSPMLETNSPQENPSLLSPTVRRCCMECPDENGTKERRLSRSETGSDSSKDSSIQSDTSLDSEDSCISVIFVPNPELKNQSDGSRPKVQSQRSTSNSSESSESPTGRGSPMSPSAKVISPKGLNKQKIPKIMVTENSTEQSKSEEYKYEIKETDSDSSLIKQVCKTRTFGGSMLPRIPEHKSFELEDLPTEHLINCHPHGLAERVEIEHDNNSPHPARASKFDYPIVKHHPLFAKTHKVSSGISSLLLGENIEFTRKPGQSSSQGVQTVRKGTPKLLTFEIYNPETDDLDSDTSLSSSPDSEKSIVSVINESYKSASKHNLSDSLDIKEEALSSPKDDEIVFNFETESMKEPEEESSMSTHSLFNSDEISRKSEMRKAGLLNLLGENKNILQNINDSQIKCNDVEKVVMKTVNHMQSMEDLFHDKDIKKESSLTDLKKCISEPIPNMKNYSSLQGSLDSIKSICEGSRLENKMNPKEKDIDCDPSKIQETNETVGKSIDLTKIGKNKLRSIEDDIMPEIVISDASEESETVGTVNTKDPEEHVENGEKSIEVVENSVDSETDRVTIDFSSHKSIEEKPPESCAKIENDCHQPSTSTRIIERRGKREDSLDSNTPSVKSSIYHSDTGSVMSHRFSTVSISSNVSSDVSFGNNSAVSGSSCYLASMSSADFDDRPPLASSFSLSEAEENEYLSSQANLDHENNAESSGVPSSMISNPVKKDQLSPPKPEIKSQDRPKLKLFKRNGHESRSKSSSNDGKRSLQSSYESRSRDADEPNGAKPKSRIGSSLTPDTSMDQSTCVERCSSSFEEELMRSFNNDEKDKDSASDSEDSAEAGGSLTHHRYYHVFREGEIDHLIEKYVENLHIISSYYDHSNWCVVAEKVNVWTI